MYIDDTDVLLFLSVPTGNSQDPDEPVLEFSVGEFNEIWYDGLVELPLKPVRVLEVMMCFSNLQNLH